MAKYETKYGSEWTMSAKDAGAIPYLPVPPFTDMVNLNPSIDK